MGRGTHRRVVSAMCERVWMRAEDSSTVLDRDCDPWRRAALFSLCVQLHAALLCASEGEFITSADWVARIGVTRYCPIYHVFYVYGFLAVHFRYMSQTKIQVARAGRPRCLLSSRPTDTAPRRAMRSGAGPPRRRRRPGRASCPRPPPLRGCRACMRLGPSSSGAAGSARPPRGGVWRASRSRRRRGGA